MKIKNWHKNAFGKIDKTGFTLLELLIAPAILAIIAAILIPNFFLTTDRARLRSDIQSARVIQNAIDLYNAERTPSISGDMDAILERLHTSGFLRERYARPQTEGATWGTHTTLGVVVNITASADNIHQIYAGLPASERQFVTGGRGGS